MNVDFNAPIFRTIRLTAGKPLTLWILIVILGGRTGITSLQELTGWQAPTIRTTLKKLSDLGIVRNDRLRDGWILTEIGGELRKSIGTEIALSDPRTDKNYPLRLNSIESLIDLESVKEESIITGTDKNYLFVPDPDIVQRLIDLGVWEKDTAEIAGLIDNDPELLEDYFNSGEDVPLIIWKIRNGVPPKPTKKPTNYGIPCPRCAAINCAGDCEDQE